jgi:hypothetical protein
LVFSKALCAVTLVSLGLTDRAKAEVPSAVAIRNARIVTVSGDDLPSGTVLLRNGMIQDVGANVAIPADAWVIDGSGLTVYPGFIDSLSTWGIPASAPASTGTNRTTTAAPALATPAPLAPSTPIHGPEDRPQTYSFERAADLVSPSDPRLDSVRAAGFSTAATFPNRGIFEGLGAVVDLAGARGRDMVVAQPVGQQILFRTGGGGMGRAFPASLMGNIAYVRQLYLDLDQYKQAKQIYKEHAAGNKRPEYDHTLEGLADSPRVLLPANEAQQIERMVRFGPELKMPFVLYGLHEGYRCVDLLKQANVPVLISLKWPEKPKDADPTDVQNYRNLLMQEQAPGVPGMLSKAGVKFAFYSDGVDSAPDLKKALKRVVDAGLSRHDLIRALTLSPAEIYGLSDRLGSIGKGKIANLVVMRGEAFDDKTTVEYVFVDGQEFKPSKDLQEGPKKGGADASGAKPADASGDDQMRGDVQ